MFLHGGTLARYDISSKKEIWSRQLIDQQLIKDAVATESGNVRAVAALGKDEDMTQFIERGMEAGLQLQVDGSNVWVSAPDKLTHYDWDTGKVLQEIPLAGGFGEMVSQGGELLMMGESEAGQQLITHINLATGESRTEAIGPPGKPAVAVARNAPGTMVVASAGGAAGSPTAGLPLVPGANAGKAAGPGESRGAGAKFAVACADRPARVAGQQHAPGTHHAGSQR